MGLVTPSPPRRVVWRPNSPQQIRFLEFAGFEALYGGAAGGGKSAALLASLLRFAHFPDFHGVLFRRTFGELEQYVIPRAEKLFPRVFPGADYNAGKHFWIFPSGARIDFAHMQHEKDALEHKSAEYHQACFDELTTFTRFQYTYIISRLRSTNPEIPIMLRAGTNPGDSGHEWVFERFAPWLDPEAEKNGMPRAKSGKALWYMKDKGDADKYVPRPRGVDHRVRSRLFVQSRAVDNPDLMNADPGYVERLRELDPVTQEQLINGNWLIRLVAGTLFKRVWFDEVEQAPFNLRQVRFWDRAATKPTKQNPDPDWTRGILLGEEEPKEGQDQGYLYVLDMKSLRDVPGKVKELIHTTAKDDGVETQVGLWQDPAAAGKFEIADYVTLLRGFDVRAYLQSKNKVTYARPVSAQAFARKIRVVKGAWNRAFYEELEGFPDPTNWHDDQVDVLSGGYLALRSWERTVADDWLSALESGAL